MSVIIVRCLCQFHVNHYLTQRFILRAWFHFNNVYYFDRCIRFPGTALSIICIRYYVTGLREKSQHEIICENLSRSPSINSISKLIARKNGHRAEIRLIKFNNERFYDFLVLVHSFFRVSMLAYGKLAIWPGYLPQQLSLYACMVECTSIFTSHTYL